MREKIQEEIQEPSERAGRAPDAPATTEAKPRSTLSADSRWWWNGRRWVPAVTDDGLWQWDGSGWQPTIDLEGQRPADLATTLALLAEDRHTKAATILVERVEEWQPDGEVRERVREIQRRSRRPELASILPERPRGLFRWLRAARPASNGVEDGTEVGATEERSLLVALGRAAPQPTIKEADDVLLVARMLEERAGELTAGLAAVDEAERARAAAVAAAQQGLVTADDARRRMLQRARRRLEAAEAAHRDALNAARSRLRALLAPGVGAPRARVGPLHLHAMALETPSGRLPADGVSAELGRAAALWSSHHELLLDAIATELPGSQDFATALGERSALQFVLLTARGGMALWCCPPGKEGAARSFVRAVNENAPEAGAARLERESEASRIEAELKADRRDETVEAAAASLARAEADPAPKQAIEAARRQVEEARADPPALTEARGRLAEVAKLLGTPPEAL